MAVGKLTFFPIFLSRDQIAGKGGGITMIAKSDEDSSLAVEGRIGRERERKHKLL